MGAIYNPKNYFDMGRTVLWGMNLGQEVMQALRLGEIVTVLNLDLEPYSELLMDSWDVLREKLYISGGSK